MQTKPMGNTQVPGPTHKSKERRNRKPGVWTEVWTRACPRTAGFRDPFSFIAVLQSWQVSVNYLSPILLQTFSYIQWLSSHPWAVYVTSDWVWRVGLLFPFFSISFHVSLWFSIYFLHIVCYFQTLNESEPCRLDFILLNHRQTLFQKWNGKKPLSCLWCN